MNNGIAERSAPEPGPFEQAPPAPGSAEAHAHGIAAIMRLLNLDPDARAEHHEMLPVSAAVQERARRIEAAGSAEAEARHRLSSLAVKLDSAGERTLGYWAGSALVVSLMALDAIPLNWAAQAFGLDPGGTWLVTLILLAASVGAALGFEITRGRPGPRRTLTAAAAAGYLALLGLRTEFLLTVAGDTWTLAFLQSALLTALSAGLVWCGSVVLAKTRNLTLTRAHAALRRAAAATREARAAYLPLAIRLDKHLFLLRQRLLTVADRAGAPEGVAHAEWVAMLGPAIKEWSTEYARTDEPGADASEARVVPLWSRRT